MPELPELEVLTRQLRDRVVGRTITGVHCAQPKMLNLPLPEFEKRATGRLNQIGRRGKYALLYEDDGCLWLHLGLSAEVRLLPQAEKEPKPTVSFLLDDGTDLRMAKVFMGSASFLSPAASEERSRELGAEPLSQDFTINKLAEVLAAKPGWPVKGVLMEQQLIAGIGNLYSDEILRSAGINPLTKASALSPAEIAKLHEALDAILRAAIAAGGDEDYTDLSGQRGRFEPAVHGREVCRVCGSLVKKIKVQGRTAYYCTHCNP